MRKVNKGDYNELGIREVKSCALMHDQYDLAGAVSSMEDGIVMGGYGEDWWGFMMEVRIGVMVMDDGSSEVSVDVVGVMFRDEFSGRMWERERKWLERGEGYWEKMRMVLNWRNGLGNI